MSFLTDLIDLKPRRTLGIIRAQAVLEERHTDDLTITEHPVEQGAQITDHAFKRPSEVVLRYGWSKSFLAGLLGSVSALQPNLAGGNLDEVYKSLLQLQASRIPFDIVTGKRKYKNMLLKSLAVTTDAGTENALVVTATCVEIILVQTKATTLPPKTQQKTPKKTAAKENKGVKQTKPAVPSPGGADPAGRWRPRAQDLP